MLKSIRQWINRVLPSDLGEQYRTMHAQGAFPGQTFRSHLGLLELCIPGIHELRILDYGCGPHGGMAQVHHDRVIPYDPYIERFSELPWQKPFDVFFSSDVFEHVPENDIGDILKSASTAGPKHVFLVISTRKAHKTLPSGVNAHATVRSGRWWLENVAFHLGSSYRPQLAFDDLLRSDVVLCFERQ
jgi:hypothetical protein